jgi:RNA polymerase sigma-70 factor (ECF subfamily)
MPIVDDDRSVRRVLRGESDAFADLVRRYQKPIFNLMRRELGSPQEAADLTQEAFFQAYRKLESFTTGREFFPWLYTLSLNLLRSHQRRHCRPTLSLEDLPPGEVPQEQPAGLTPSEANELERALSRLPLEMREALLLRYREQWSIKEIAAALALSSSAAKMRVHRGIERLRMLLTEDEDV